MHMQDAPDNARQAALHAIRDCYLGLDARTQRARLLEALHTLGGITTFEASRHLDVYHPPARGKELRDEGHRITTLRRRVETEAGAAHWVGLYLLVRQSKAGGEK